MVRALSNFSSAISIPSVPINPDVIEFSCQICFTKFAVVVFPLVPVIPIAFMLSNGCPYNQAEIAPTISRGFGCMKDGIEPSIFLSLNTATAPLLIACSKYEMPCVLAPAKAINRSPGNTFCAFIETPLITTC